MEGSGGAKTQSGVGRLIDLVSGIKSLDAVEGVEASLRRRFRRGNRQSLTLLSLGVVLQAVPLLTGKDLASLSSALAGPWSWAAVSAAGPQLIGLALIVFAAVVYLLVRHSALLLEESREPFRYSFHVDSFVWVQDAPPKARHKLEADDRLQLLHLDLTARIASRIKRLSLLRNTSPTGEPEAGPTHIAIAGDICLREDPETNGWTLFAMPRICIGAAGAAQLLAHTVKLRLSSSLEGKTAFTPKQYDQFCERVYASVAFTVYRRIDRDLEAKLRLFPTTYRRAVARLNEAEDLASSNTIDAIERAARLYEGAERDLDKSMARAWARVALRFKPLLLVNYNVYCDWSAMLSGLAYCRISYSRMSAAMGRWRGAVATYALRKPLEDLVDDLEKVHEYLVGHAGNIQGETPAASHGVRSLIPWVRAWRQYAKRRRARIEKALFDAHVALALAHAHSGNALKAKDLNNEARRKVVPKVADEHRFHLWLRAEENPEIDVRIAGLRALLDIHPNFQLAQLELALWTEVRARFRGETTSGGLEPALREYRRVLEINPGNVAALVSMGYIHWFSDELDKAQVCYLEGLDLKEVARETFAAELHHGYARVLAEKAAPAEEPAPIPRRQLDEPAVAQPPVGEPSPASVQARLLMQALELYGIAASTDPDLLAANVRSDRRTGSGPFHYMTPATLRRFRRFRRRVRAAVRHAVKESGAQDDEWRRLTQRLRGHVDNDVGQAAFELHVRLPDPRVHKQARRCFANATRRVPSLAPAWLNAYICEHWDGSLDTSSLDVATQLAPEWPTLGEWRIGLLPQKRDADRARLEAERKACADRHQKLDAERREIERQAERQRQKDKGEHQASQSSPIERSTALLVGAAELRLAELSSRQAAAKKALDECDVRRKALVGVCRERVRDEIMYALQRLPRGEFNVDDEGAIPGSKSPHPYTKRLEGVHPEALTPQHLRILTQCGRALLGLDEWGPEARTELRKLTKALRERFAEEDFDLTRLRRDVLRIPSPDGQPDEERAELEEIQSLLDSARERDAKEDPWHCNVLEWLFVDAKKPACAIEAWERAATHPNADQIIKQSLARVRMGWADKAPNTRDAVHHADRAAKLLRSKPSSQAYAEMAKHRRRHKAKDWAERVGKGHVRADRAERDRPLPELRRRRATWHARVAALAATARDWIDAAEAVADWLGHEPHNHEAHRRFNAAVQQAEKLVSMTEERQDLLGLVDKVRADTFALQRAPSEGARLFREWRVTPIVIELADDLHTELARQPPTTPGGDDDRDASDVSKRASNELQTRIWERHRVRVPRLRFVRDGSRKPGSFALLVNEVLVKESSVRERESDTLEAPRDMLQRTAKLLASNPSPARGSFIFDRTTVLRLVEAALEDELATLLGPQDVDHLLEEAGVGPQASVRLQPRRLSRLTALCRALLAQRLPLPPVVELMQLVNEESEPHDFDALVLRARARPAVRKHLLERVARCRLVDLSPQLEETLSKSLRGDGDSRCLAMDYEGAQDLLECLKYALDDENDRAAPALLVQSWHLVTGLAGFLKLEWPSGIVVAASELPPKSRFDVKRAWSKVCDVA